MTARTDRDQDMAPVQAAVSYPNVPIDAEREIRVLEIQPTFFEGRLDEQLRCTLVVRSLEKASLKRSVPCIYGHPADGHRDYCSCGHPTDGHRYFCRYGYPADDRDSFEALSYAWGSWTHCSWILLNGQDFRITRNLYLALRRLKRYHAIRRVWVDQICINQQASDERASQVRRMGSIFSLASNVVIWLGESALPLSQRSTPGYYGVLSQLARAVNSTTPAWWTRAWVVQERLLASGHPEVIFGPISITWIEVCNNVLQNAAKASSDARYVQALLTLAWFHLAKTDGFADVATARRRRRV